VQSTRITTAPTWSAAAVRRAPEALKVAAFGVVVLVLEVALAHGVSGPEISKYVFLFVGLYVLAFVFRFPLATALVVFFFTDCLFAATKFSHNVGSISVRPPEVALACLFLLAVVRPKRRTWGGPVGGALAVFLALVGISAVIAIKSGDTSLSEAFNWARPLALLTFFYIVIRLFPEADDRRHLLTGVAVLAAISGFAAILLSLGAGFVSSLGENRGVGEVSGEAGSEGVERIRLVGLSASYALFWYSVVQVIAQRHYRRIFWGVLLAGMVAAIILSYNRNMWLGLLIGAVLMAAVGGQFVRGRMAIGVVALVGVLAMLLAFGGQASNQGVVKPLLKRGSTLFHLGKTEKESSLEDRARETEKAWDAAQEHLLIGVGAGAPFGLYDHESIVSGNFSYGETTSPQLFLHNQYVYLILIAGVPGLIAFLAFVLMVLFEALRRVPRDPAITACAVGLTGILISSVVAIYLTVPDMTGLIGLLAGVIIADRDSRAAAGEPSGLIPAIRTGPDPLPPRLVAQASALNRGVPRSARAVRR
jgi:O-antigen ligase